MPTDSGLMAAQSRPNCAQLSGGCHGTSSTVAPNWPNYAQLWVTSTNFAPMVARMLDRIWPDTAWPKSAVVGRSTRRGSQKRGVSFPESERKLDALRGAHSGGELSGAHTRVTHPRHTPPTSFWAARSDCCTDVRPIRSLDGLFRRPEGVAQSACPECVPEVRALSACPERVPGACSGCVCVCVCANFDPSLVLTSHGALHASD